MIEQQTNKQLDPLALHELARVLPLVMSELPASPTKTEVISIEYIRHEGPPTGWVDGGGPDGECGNYVYDDSLSCGQYKVTLHHVGQTYDKAIERVYFECSHLRDVLEGAS